MKKIKLTLQNATYAIKARNLLTKGGLRVKIARLTSPTEGGCTHGIEISENDLFSAADILRRGGVNYRVIH